MSAHRAGKYRHRVRFDRLASASDSNGLVQDQETGALIRNWIPVATVWASIEPMSAREFNAAGGTQGEFSARIGTRYDSRIADAANMRAVHVRTVNGVTTETPYDIAGPLADTESGLEHFTFPAKAGITNGE